MTERPTQPSGDDEEPAYSPLSSRDLERLLDYHSTSTQPIEPPSGIDPKEAPETHNTSLEEHLTSGHQDDSPSLASTLSPLPMLSLTLALVVWVTISGVFTLISVLVWDAVGMLLGE